ncbi:MAG: dienelactone hydrolase family protein [Tepidamorphaceae bacterium]|nr:dienelactone hydrolase family protein [Rhodobiaceae bacterium]MCC0049458.1 dienelactone hydrolase family protein [Rhodobiaceae bacterium]
MCTIDGCGSHRNMPPITVSEPDRRAFLAGLASLPLATVLAFPDLAHAQAERTEPLVIGSPDGEPASGVIAMPDKLPAPAVVLIHEWWGLNDQIKAVAAELANLGYIAYAIDLYGGEIATTPDEALSLVQRVDADKATSQFRAAIEHLRKHKDSNGKVATMGWCFGGGWSLNASIATPVDATVIYYGRVTRSAEDLKRLKGPVLGHFGTLDKNINAEMVGGFEQAMKEAGKAASLTVNWYEADHAFANPTGARYDADDARLAWERTQAFLKENLKG